MQQLDLNGAWTMRWREAGRGRLEWAEADDAGAPAHAAGAIDARVPGDAHLDFLRAGLIADPYEGTNALCARWIEECQFAYRREFTPPADAMTADESGRVWLVFEGLELTARILLNGRDVGRHDNAFYPCRIDVTGHLHQGKNVLVVYLESGLYGTTSRPAKDEAGGGNALVKSQWMRKARVQAGGNWSPRLLNVGIPKSVRLEWTTAAARIEELVPVVELSEDFTRAAVRARVWIEGLQDQSAGPLSADLSAEMVDTGEKAMAGIQILPGLNAYDVTVDVADPQLWWPSGHGAQILYWLRVTLHMDEGTRSATRALARPATAIVVRPRANPAPVLGPVQPRGREVAEAAARIGFRRVRVNQDLHPSGGRFFYLEVNGRKIFTKGANWLPFDMVLANQDSVRLGQLLDLAVDCHLNFLRVHALGEYGSDEFFTLCDKKGLMVWQEFPAAKVSALASDAEFFEDVKREVVSNVRRIARHPSLIAWCGHSEPPAGAFANGEAEGNGAFYQSTLPQLIAQEDPTRYYQPTTPWSPDGQPFGSDDAGTQHAWAVGPGTGVSHDYRRYRQMTGRFPLEGGFPGTASLPTVLSCLPEAQREVHSFAWEIHANAPTAIAAGSDGPDAALAEHLGLDSGKLTVEDYAYWAGLVQGEALGEFCGNFRRRMFDSAAAVLWTFNDVWPATRGSALVDYQLRRTPGYWAARRELAPLHLVLSVDGEQVLIWGINDTAKAVGGDLRFGLFNVHGGFTLNRMTRAVLPPNTSAVLATLPADKWRATDLNVAYAELSRHERPLARNRLILPLLKQLQWPPAEVAVTMDKDRAIFESDTFAWGVCLDSSGEVPLADNLFDVWPGIPYSIPWTEPQPPQVLRVGNLTGRRTS